MMMTEHEIFADFAEVVAECTEVPVSNVTLGADLAVDLEICSLAMVEIIVSVEDRFSIKIPDEDLKYFRTVQDVVSYVRHVKRSAASI
jgi:acyl carrier protein